MSKYIETVEMVNEEIELRERLKQSIPNIKEMSYKAAKYLAELIEV